MPWPSDAQLVGDQSKIYLCGTDEAKRDVTPTMRDRFQADDRRNRSAARSAGQFLTKHAWDDTSTHTRVFVLDDAVLGFYAMSVGEAVVTSRQRRRFAARAASNRIPTAHVDWIARDKRAPAGTGDVLLSHAISVVTDDLQPVTPILALSLDPFDEETSAAWQRKGFRQTKTLVPGGLCRLFLPLTGYGSVGLPTEER